MCIYSFEGFYGTCSNEIEKKNPTLQNNNNYNVFFTHCIKIITNDHAIIERTYTSVLSSWLKPNMEIWYFMLNRLRFYKKCDLIVSKSQLMLPYL